MEGVFDMPHPLFVDFQGRKILVSGASSGLGRAICVELSRRGAELILLGRNQDQLKITEDRLESAGHHILCVDLTSHSEIYEKVKDFSRLNGRIYGLCHSAGVVETRPMNAIRVEGLRHMLDINFLAGLELARAVSRRDVMEENGGSILLISSVYGHVGMPGQIGYCGSKGAVISAARAMAIELARRKIRVNTLSPGLVRTTMTDEALSRLSQEQGKKIEEAHPLGIGTPEDVARAATFMLAPQNAWITGSDLVIDGGFIAQ
ncbi:MAG: SDR family oxidoreductase [Desulfobacteraceae bacterium]|nr:MAG: SDR family oxidoreductase [Desulfobacteraceae bacterium]